MSELNNVAETWTKEAELRAALAAATARAEAAEAQLAAVDQYGKECWLDKTVPVSFAEWLAQQGKVKP